MNKPSESVPADPRWQVLQGSWSDLQDMVASWPTSSATPNNVAEMLRTARELFVHHYFVYEFSTVAIVWALLAVEAALVDIFKLSEKPRKELSWLITRALNGGYLSTDDAGLLYGLRQIEARLAHREGQTVLSPAMSSAMLERAHQIVANLYPEGHY